jgi:hypothetical protein
LIPPKIAHSKGFKEIECMGKHQLLLQLLAGWGLAIPALAQTLQQVGHGRLGVTDEFNSNSLASGDWTLISKGDGTATIANGLLLLEPGVHLEAGDEVQAQIFGELG